MTPSYVVDRCNELGRHQRALRTLRKRHMERAWTDTWGDEHSALVSAFAIVSVELLDYRERVARLCDPWFKVTQQ